MERNVLTIQANFNDELMVDNKPMPDVKDLKETVKEFMVNKNDDPELPDMLDVTKQFCEGKIDTLKRNIESDPNNESFELWKIDLKDWEARLDAVKVVGSFRVIPKLSVISVQTDNGTSYEYYIKIQDALKGAINDLRNEWCMKAYNKKYTDLKEDNPADMEKIRIIRAIVPERIAEMEP